MGKLLQRKDARDAAIGILYAMPSLWALVVSAMSLNRD
jgi:hypothetical protein